jgi:hypothetical protein
MRRITAPGLAASTPDNDSLIRGETDGTTPDQFENLGSWASLDDGDVSVSARHTTLSGPSLQCKRQSSLRVVRAKSGITRATNHGVHSQVIGRFHLSAASVDPRLVWRGVPLRVPPAPRIQGLLASSGATSDLHPNWLGDVQGRVSALRGATTLLVESGTSTAVATRGCHRAFDWPRGNGDTASAATCDRLSATSWAEPHATLTRAGYQVGWRNGANWCR